MKTSRFAPKTPIESLTQSRTEKLKQEKAKATRLLGRLRWKAESLVASYIRAMEILHAEVNQNGQLDRHYELRHPFVLGTGSKQAESMFKVDFFEFYAVMERYITTCLAILGINVSATVPRTNVNALKFITNPDLQRTRSEASHAFHANLLEALDDANGPLHSSFGTQDVQIQLRLAKDYRNAWKDADEKIGPTSWHDGESETRKNVKLQDLDLELLLRTLIAACEHAHGIIQGQTEKNFDPNSVTSRDFETQYYSNESMEMDVPLEYMDDAMDLD